MCSPLLRPLSGAVVALNLQHHVYEARECITPDALTVIHSGLCARRLLVLTRGGVLGIDVIIKDKHWGLRDLDSAHCLTFVQTASIDRETLFSIVVGHFPVARRYLTYAAAVLTIRSAFRRAIALWKKQQRMLKRGDLKQLRSFYDNEWHDGHGGHGGHDGHSPAAAWIDDGPEEGGGDEEDAAGGARVAGGPAKQTTKQRQERAAQIACRCLSSVGAAVASRRQARCSRWLERSSGDRVSAGWDMGMALTQASKRAKRRANGISPEVNASLFALRGMRAARAAAGAGGQASTDPVVDGATGVAAGGGTGGAGGASLVTALSERITSLESALGQLTANSGRAQRDNASRLELMDEKLEAVLRVLGELNAKQRQPRVRDRNISCSLSCQPGLSSQVSFDEGSMSQPPTLGSPAISRGTRGSLFGPRPLCSAGSACFSEKSIGVPGRLGRGTTKGKSLTRTVTRRRKNQVPEQVEASKTASCENALQNAHQCETQAEASLASTHVLPAGTTPLRTGTPGCVKV